MLELNGVTKYFGGIAAARDVGFEVQRGNIVALIGPNGAGKTTIFNLITGAQRPDQGVISLKGKNILGLKPYQTALAGITRTFQNLQLFNSMTVLENVMAGAHLRGQKGFIRSIFSYPERCSEEKKIREESLLLLKEVGLADAAGSTAAVLPFGQQRLLEIARALASNPNLILLDEPAAGLNAAESEDLARYLKKLRDRGTTMILIEHDMETVMEAADRIVVLNFGEVIAEGTPAQIQNNRAVITAYLGEDEQIA